MLKRLFPSESSRYKHIQNLVKRINSDIIDRLEIFFPMWLMFAFQHYLIKSYDIAIFSAMNIEPNRFYMFSMICREVLQYNIFGALIAHVSFSAKPCLRFQV